MVGTTSLLSAEIIKQQTAGQSVTVDHNTEVSIQNAAVSGNVSHTSTPNTATAAHETSTCNSTAGVVNLIDQFFRRVSNEFQKWYM